jgi:octaprenyl-diphosphate synthase
LVYIIKNENKDPQKVKTVIDTVMATGGIAYASGKMTVYRDEALEILNSFPESPVRKALEDLVRFTTDRKY